MFNIYGDNLPLILTEDDNSQSERDAYEGPGDNWTEGLCPHLLPRVIRAPNYNLPAAPWAADRQQTNGALHWSPHNAR